MFTHPGCRGHPPVIGQRADGYFASGFFWASGP